MFHAFKPLLLTAAILLLTHPLLANSQINIDPLTAFHHQNTSYEVLEQFSLQDQKERLTIEVFITNLDEPYDNPLNINVFVKCGDQNFARLSRKFNNQDEQTYCQVSSPQIVNGQEIQLKNKEYLVIPVHRFDEQSVQCPSQWSNLEVVPLDSFFELCS